VESKAAFCFALRPAHAQQASQQKENGIRERLLAFGKIAYPKGWQSLM
jgi:hypothetical protein